MERYGNIKGGKVIGVGGYGCVFSPPLPCKDGKQPTAGMVSKLMETDEAVKEMDEIKRVTDRLGEISNAGRYFGGFDTYICEAESITPEDVMGYDCNIADVSKLVRDARSPLELPELSILQQKDLGVTVNDYLLKVASADDLREFFKNMVELLIKGILPMNAKGVYHLDVKSDNVLVKDNMPVLIDWGLSYLTDDGKPVVDARTRGNTYDPDKTNVPMAAYSMFNEPLVARAFYETADAVGGNLDMHGLSSVHTIRTVLHRLYHNRFDQDHFRYLLGGIVNPMLEVMIQYHASRKESYPYMSSDALVTHYLSRQRDVYSRNGRVDHDKLYADFFYNVDIWGWVMAFAPLLRSDISGASGSLSKFLSDGERRKVRLIAAKMVEYLFVSETDRYDVSDLVAYVENAVVTL